MKRADTISAIGMFVLALIATGAQTAIAQSPLGSVFTNQGELDLPGRDDPAGGCRERSHL